MTEAERYPLAYWMEGVEGWEYVPRESALYEFAAEAAGCDGRVFANPRIPELVLCDGADLILWKIGDAREPIEERRALALEIAKMATELTFKAVMEEREQCAKIADEQRKLWSNPQAGDDAGAAAAAGIAAAIRKRGKETPERGGDVVDDAGPGGDRPSQPPPDFEPYRVPANACLSWGKKLDAATRVEGDGEKPEPGSISLCLHCGHMMAFADDMSLRELNKEEAYELAGDPMILEFQRVRGMVMAKEDEPWPAKPQDDSEPPSPTPPKND